MVVVLEVEGVDGIARRIQLRDTCNPDWRALVCDKAGVPPAPCASGCSRPCDSSGGHRASLFDTVLGGDLADSVLMRLGPAALALLSGASRLMRARCGRDALRVRHWRGQFVQGADGVCKEMGTRDAAGSRFHGYLGRMVAAARASGQATGHGSGKGRRWDAADDGSPCAQPPAQEWQAGELRTAYAVRMAARRKVRQAWDLGVQFLASAAPLGPGLTDSEIWDLER